MELEHLTARLPSDGDAFRWVDGGSDGFPGLIVECFGKVGVFSLFRPQCTLSETRLQELAAHCAKRFDLEGIYRKELFADRSQGPSPQAHFEPSPWWGNPVESPVVAREAGVRFHVWPFDGFHVGWFVDQRENHRAVRRLHSGGELLNLFCYTGAFSLGPAVDGARTTNVDLSRKLLDRCRGNLALNGVDPENHRFFAEDCGKFIARSLRRGDTYQTIVLDPPTFSRHKKNLFRVTEALGPMAADCFRLLAPGGNLWVSTNTHQWTLAQLVSVIQTAIPQGRVTPTAPAGPDCSGSGEVKAVRVQNS